MLLTIEYEQDLSAASLVRHIMPLWHETSMGIKRIHVGTLSPEAALRSNMGLTKKRLFEASRCFCVSKIPDHA